MKKLFFLLLSLWSCAALAADSEPTEIHLWPNGAPGFESRANEKEAFTIHREPYLTYPVVSNIHNPSITLYLPPAAAAPTAAVIVAPGGGHRFLTMGPEGYEVGKYLSEHGIAAFVLKYRLAHESNSVYKVEIHALQDAQRAILLVRSRAQEWNVNPKAVGILGFSAGGEIAALASAKFDSGVADAADSVDRFPCRPDFQGLIYPGGARSIVVASNSPPAFLACAADDRPDISEGLAEVYLKFKQAKIPVELHIYGTGGHGFGVRTRPTAVSFWQARFYDWMMDQKFTIRPAITR